jgi:DNA-directed RNA polymerase subunit K/omega
MSTTWDASYGLVPEFLTADDSHDVVIRCAETACITKFEQAQIIGHRASELAAGAEPRARPEGVTNAKWFDPVAYATAEFHAGVIQGLSVVRKPPNREEVVLDIADLTVANTQYRPW